jgi:hypothetical protein
VTPGVDEKIQLAGESGADPRPRLPTRAGAGVQAGDSTDEWGPDPSNWTRHHTNRRPLATLGLLRPSEGSAAQIQ